VSELVCKSGVETDCSGEFVSYTRLLTDAISKGLSLGRAHEQAISSLTRFQGPVVIVFPQPFPAQMPAALHDIFLGLTTHQGDVRNLPDHNAPLIVETSEDKTVLPGEAPTLYVKAQDESGFDSITGTFDASNLSVFAVITAPIDGVNPPEQRLINLTYNSQARQHTITLNGFPQSQFSPDVGTGGYAVSFYAKDPTDNLSTVSSLTITVEADNSIPRWKQF